jgi:hypothetical protein
VTNAGSNPVQVSSVWLPHGRFRSEERQLTPATGIQPQASAQLDALVRFDEPAGAIVENGFIILTVLSDRERWQVFARLRVSAGAGREPHAEVELITCQREGSLPATLET